MNLKDLIGKDVYLRPTGNYARFSSSIAQDSVESVSRVFITLRNKGKLRIIADKGEYLILSKDGANGGYDLYHNKENLKKQQQKEKIRISLYQIFNGYSKDNFTYEQLTTVAGILGIEYHE